MVPTKRLFYSAASFWLAVSTQAIAEPVSLQDAYTVLVPAKADDTGRDKPTGLNGRVVTGYQGWFRAEGDGSDLGFSHYAKKGKFEPGFCSIDLWPDLSEFSDEEKFATSFRHADGSTAHVFSSLHPKTVDRHFRWMKEYGIDGAFVQRFAVLGGKNHRSYSRVKADNQKLIHCRNAAIAHGRCYTLMYDLSGWKGSDFEYLARDWKMLRNRMQLGTDPNDSAYLQFKGKPLVAIWGVGFNDDRAYSLEDAERFIRLLKHNPDWGGMSIMLGVPYGWREQNRDAVKDDRLHAVLRLADVISPWSIGRYHKVDEKLIQHQRADKKWCDQHDITYLPVVYPGFSWHNMYGAKIDQIPRRKGEFLWNQFTAVKKAGNQTAYVAMFDEVDEATAIFKCTNNPPNGGGSQFLTYEGLPSDHYLKLTGKGGKLLRGEIAPR